MIYACSCENFWTKILEISRPPRELSSDHWAVLPDPSTTWPHLHTPRICFGLNQCQGLHALELIRRAAAHWSSGRREHCDGLSGCDEKSGKVCPYVSDHPICSWFWLGHIHFFLCNGMLQRIVSLPIKLRLFPPVKHIFQLGQFKKKQTFKYASEHLCCSEAVSMILLLATICLIYNSIR